jgi:GNAT superfamily N-acetyltransferase
VNAPITDLKVRRIRPSDGPLLRRLRLRSLQDAPEAYGQTLQEAVALPDAHWQGASREASQGDQLTWLLAHQAGAPVGIVCGRRRAPETLLIFSLWVDPETRHAGVGRALIAAVEAWARAWGATESVLWVLVRNARAVDFYARLGFTLLRSGPDAANGHRFGAVTMHRALDPVEAPSAVP